MPVRRLKLLACICTALAFPSANAAPLADPLGLEALHGKVVYVDFWASWCAPCRESFPWMNEVQREFERDGLVVIAVNVDADRADAERFIRKFVPDFRIAYDPAGALAEQFRVQGMPTSFLIDRSGRVLRPHAGFRLKDRASLEQDIRAALASH